MSQQQMSFCHEQVGKWHRACSTTVRGVVLIAECSEMALSIGDHSYGVSSQATVRAGGLRDEPKVSSARQSNFTKLLRVEGRRVDLKKRASVLKRSIEDCDRMARDLDQEVKDEEHRVKVYDPSQVTYSAYAAASAFRRDNLKRSADELRAHLAHIEQLVREYEEIVTP
jgi:hypothetical protein